MSFVGNGNFNNHWTGKEAKKELLNSGFAEKQLENLSKKDLISLVAGTNPILSNKIKKNN